MSNKINGAVLDGREPLPGASVFLTDANGTPVNANGYMVGAATDHNGNFTIANAPQGATHITARFLGYNQATKPIEANNVFILRREAATLNEATVTASYLKPKKSNLPVILAIIGAVLAFAALIYYLNRRGNATEATVISSTKTAR